MTWLWPCVNLAARIKVKSSKSTSGSLVSPIVAFWCCNNNNEGDMSEDGEYIYEGINEWVCGKKIKMEGKERDNCVCGELMTIRDRVANCAVRQRSMIKRYRMLPTVAS